MDVQIKEVVTSAELNSFIRFPHTLYRGNPYWVPNLDEDERHTLQRDKNPAFEHCEAKYWLAYSQGKIVGRIAGIINRLHIQKWNQPYLRFNWFDFVDDPAVPAALFNAVEAWARENHLSAVHGPLGFTDMDREGMLVEGFDELGTMATIYNFPYYPVHMERLGYKKDADWMEYEISVPSAPNETIARVAEIALRRNHVRLLQARNKNELLKYAVQLFDLLNDAYQHLYSYVPLTRRQIDAYVKQYFGFITPDFVPIVLDANDRLVGFGITMPSLTRALQKAGGRLFPFGFLHLMRALKKNDRVDLYLVAVHSDYKGKGINAILMNKMQEIFIKMGITKVESNPELELNQLVQSQWKFFETRQHKRRRCYIKQL